MPRCPVQANRADARPTYRRPVPCLATGLRMFDRGDRQSVLTGSPRQECLRSGMADVLPGGLPDPEPHTSDTLDPTGNGPGLQRAFILFNVHELFFLHCH